MFHLRLYMVLWVNTFFFKVRLFMKICSAGPGNTYLSQTHRMRSDGMCQTHPHVLDINCVKIMAVLWDFIVLFYFFVGKLKGEILMSIHQKKLSSFSMKWKLPFLEKWGIPCWGKERNVKKCKFSSFVYIFKIGDFI